MQVQGDGREKICEEGEETWDPEQRGQGKRGRTSVANLPY